MQNWRLYKLLGHISESPTDITLLTVWDLDKYFGMVFAVIKIGC